MHGEAAGKRRPVAEHDAGHTRPDTGQTRNGRTDSGDSGPQTGRRRREPERPRQRTGRRLTVLHQLRGHAQHGGVTQRPKLRALVPR